MSEPHCPSYYAASRNDNTAHPQLQGDVTADICVIGGGFTGVSTALDLAERGFSVVIVEQNRIGWGASGRNGGQVGYGTSGEEGFWRTHGPEVEPLLDELQWRGHDIIRSRVKKYDIECDLKLGNMAASFKPRQMDKLKEDFDYFAARGFEDNFELVSKHDMRDYIGSDIYIGGLYNNKDFHLHPLNLCLGEARAACGLGVRIFENSEVEQIIHGKTPTVVTAKGRVKAQKVVIAGNAYHHLERKKMAGVLFPAGTYMIATEPLNDDQVHEILPRGQSVHDTNTFLAYYRFSADKRLLFGGECNYSGRDPKSIKDTMLPYLTRAFPKLDDVKIDYEWGGMIGITVTRTPHVGCINGNVYYSEGYCGHGINATHLLSEIISDAITGQLERYDLFAKARQVRIPVPRWVGNQMLALGMLYHRIKDLF